VIPAGGAGTRLWPWSNQATPKHLLDLTGNGRSLLQQTYERVAPLAEAVFVLTEERQVGMIREQLPEARFIVEPTARGTVNALGLAALEIAGLDPEAIMVSVAADHVIQDADGYRESIAAAVRTAAGGDRLVTIGLRPTYPATGFGYIRVGEKEGDAYRVAEFVEKPTLPRAEQYLAAGSFYWNLSMFAWRASVFLAELERVAPAHHRGLLAFRAGTGSYGDLPNEAVDYAVLEKTDRLYLVPAGFDWLDVGSWAELLDMLETDANGNSIDGESAVIDTTGSLLSAPGKLVAAIGIENLIVIDTDQALLVLPRSRAQDVKKIVEMLRNAGKTTYL
jgi:mannose-1-phosphate guanylyltransferase/mannose-6-phosphate isomerase